MWSVPFPLKPTDGWFHARRRVALVDGERGSESVGGLFYSRPMQDVRSQNVTAVATIANVVKTSLGPKGLDKMLVDDIGDVTITNDGATILRLLEVEQPAAKVRTHQPCTS